MEWWEFFFVMIVVLPITVLWLGCIIDAIMRPDVSGWGKAGWVLFILFLPLIGSLVYVITRPAVVVAQPTLGDRAWSQPPSPMTGPASTIEPRQT